MEGGILAPVIRDKFIGGMVTLQIEYQSSAFPQSGMQVSIAAFSNGVAHLPQVWRTKGVTHMGGGYVQFQQKPALGQTDMFWSKG